MTSAWLIVVFSFAALLSSCLCAPWAVNASARASQGPWHSIKLNGDDYILYWTADSVRKVINFIVSVRTTGWVGFGLSPNGQMPNSDVVIGWMDENKVPHFTDRHTLGRYTPPEDAVKNWHLDSMKEADGYTTIKFRRDFVTCDEYGEDMDIPTGTARVIGSYSMEKPVLNADGTDYIFSWHGLFRWSKSVNLIKRGFEPDRSIPSDSNSFVVTKKEYHVPATMTTYHCSIHYLNTLTAHDPDVNILKDPIYLYKIAPLISEENRPQVHHMLVFICPTNSNIEEDGLCDVIANGTYFGCFGGQIISAWAIGGENYTFPEDVAFPIGGQNQPYKIMLEVHYDNPSSKEGLIDSSGIQFFYTKQKPVQEAGGISIAQPIVPLMIIPPYASEFRHSATCMSSCTNKYLNDDGITVFASFLHAHTIGKEIHVQHFRPCGPGGRIEELPLIDSNPSYDFDFQQLYNLPKRIKVEKDDVVKVNCVYDSSNRNMITTGGERTWDEMCQALLYYYPRSPLTNCGTFPDADTAFRPFLEKIDNFRNDSAIIDQIIKALNDDDLAEIQKWLGYEFTWTPVLIKEFQDAIETANFEREFCLEEGNSEGVQTPIVESFPGADCPYVKPNICTIPPPPTAPCCAPQVRQFYSDLHKKL